MWFLWHLTHLPQGPIYLLEAQIDLFEAPIDLLEAPIDLSEAPNDFLKPPIRLSTQTEMFEQIK